MRIHVLQRDTIRRIGTALLPRAWSSPWELALAALAIAAMVWTALAPGALPRLTGRAPTTLPAHLDDGFLADLATLAPDVPEGAAVEIAAPEAQRDVSSWYWTMAAFEQPSLVWVRAAPTPSRRASWRLARAGGPMDGSGWARVACGREWCLWRR